MNHRKVTGKGGISSKVIADNLSNDGVRLTTLEIRYHRFIHAEFMTHRMFSRNASSSRAIPVNVLIQGIKDEPATPIHWGKNRSGMKADEESTELVTLGEYDFEPRAAWGIASKGAVKFAEAFSEAEYHKQIVNRLTEPFQFITVVVTATEWDNFFALRIHKDAQPEIAELARCMSDSLSTSSPTRGGQRHLPYVEDDWMERDIPPNIAKKCSVARCARVSYLNHDQSKPSIDKDIALHDFLLKARHMSPFEHVATPMISSVPSDSDMDGDLGDRGITHMTFNPRRYWSGNFRGWVQYRQTI